MTSQAITTAISFIRISQADNLVVGKPVELDKTLIGRIEAVFEHFRLKSIDGWQQVHGEMGRQFGYIESVWVYDGNDRVVEMHFFT